MRLRKENALFHAFKIKLSITNKGVFAKTLRFRAKGMLEKANASTNTPNRHARKSRLSNCREEIFSRSKLWRRRNTLCISRRHSADPWKKDNRQAIRCFQSVSHNKKGTGRKSIRPVHTPISLCADCRCGYPQVSHLSTQGFAALGTAAGKNLAAVGSSHSLAETVNLCSMATAGLIGTLHVYTSCQNQYARQLNFQLQRHLLKDHNWSC